MNKKVSKANKPVDKASKPVCIALNKEESEILLVALYAQLGENHQLTKSIKDKIIWHRNRKEIRNDSLGDFGESEKVTSIYPNKKKPYKKNKG